MEIGRLTAYVAAVVLLLFTTSSPSSANSCTFKRISVGGVCGQVVTLLNEPIEGAEITVLERSSGAVIASTHADKDGTFKLPRVPKGDYFLRVTAGESWDRIEWPMRVSRTGQTDCKRIIVVVLSVKTGMGCWSYVTLKRRDSRNE